MNYVAYSTVTTVTKKYSPQEHQICSQWENNGQEIPTRAAGCLERVSVCLCILSVWQECWCRSGYERLCEENVGIVYGLPQANYILPLFLSSSKFSD